MITKFYLEGDGINFQPKLYGIKNLFDWLTAPLEHVDLQARRVTRATRSKTKIAVIIRVSTVSL